MENYGEILTSDKVYQKYKDKIPASSLSIDDIINKLNNYSITEERSEKTKMILEKYNEFYKKSKKKADVDGTIYLIEPKVPNIFLFLRSFV